MSADEPVGTMSYAEYLAFEREAEVKHEYVNGQVYAMAGGTSEHSRLAMSTRSTAASSRSPSSPW